MSAPAVLIILLATNELHSPATAALVQSARDTLGASTTLQLQTYSPANALPPIPESDTQHAYIVVAWEGDSHERVRISSQLPSTAAKLERVVGFSPTDPISERGRSLGFIIASLVIETPTPQPAPVKRAADTNTVDTEQSKAGPHPLWQVEAAASGSFPGAASSFGAQLGLGRSLSTRTNVGLYTEARFGYITPAQSSVRWLSVGVAGEYRLLSLTQRNDVSLVAQLGIAQLKLEHLSEDDAKPDAQHAILPQASLALRFSQRLSQHAALYGDLGVIGQPGTIEVNVHATTAANLPMAFGIAHLGIATRF